MDEPTSRDLLDRLVVAPSAAEAGARAADEGIARIQRTIDTAGQAAIVVATGASQFGVFDRLVAADIDWTRVTAFHLDEYVGLPAAHRASFRRYLRERFVDRLPRPLASFVAIDGEARDPAAECRRLGDAIREMPIAVAFVGIGENGHLAFNDPPADFATEEPYLVVQLDDACRRQQVGEGWFASIGEVPASAISMSVHRILESRSIICTVPDARKADALRAAVTGPVTPDVPASALRMHEDVMLFADPASAGWVEDARRPR